mmetsp:Transcript_8549/g.28065  ORF Transcript_8549/g.28065 Transcript_8549/m.28065 type:complete len:230 (+) Transcript_8549:429-1118(+)
MRHPRACGAEAQEPERVAAVEGEEHGAGDVSHARGAGRLGAAARREGRRRGHAPRPARGPPRHGNVPLGTLVEVEKCGSETDRGGLSLRVHESSKIRASLVIGDLGQRQDARRVVDAERRRGACQIRAPREQPRRRPLRAEHPLAVATKSEHESAPRFRAQRGVGDAAQRRRALNLPLETARPAARLHRGYGVIDGLRIRRPVAHLHRGLRDARAIDALREQNRARSKS